MGRGTQEQGLVSDQFTAVMGRRRGVKRKGGASAHEEKIAALRQHGTPEQRLKLEIDELQAKTHPTDKDVDVALSGWKRLVSDFADIAGDEDEILSSTLICERLSLVIVRILAKETEKTSRNLRWRAYRLLLDQVPPASKEMLYPTLAGEIEAALRLNIRVRLMGTDHVAPFNIHLAQEIAARKYKEQLAQELDTALGGAATKEIAAKIIATADPESARNKNFMHDLAADTWEDAIFTWLENDSPLGLKGLAARLLNPSSVTKAS